MVQIYAKYINDSEISFPPKNDKERGLYNYHLNYRQLEKDGYLPYDKSDKPEDGKFYKARYDIVKGRIKQTWLDVTPEPTPLTYVEKRAAAYPPATEYLDAQVKINSGDEAMIVAGQAQLDAYYQACLKVKEKYPKEITDAG